MRMRLAALLLGLLVVAPSAAHAADDATVTEYITVKVKKAGISLEVPKSWSSKGLSDKKNVRAALRDVAQGEPALAELLGDVISSGLFAKTRFLAIDPTNSDTLRVFLDDPEQQLMSADKIRTDAADPRWADAGIALLDATDTTVGGSRAVRTSRRLTPSSPGVGPLFLAELDVLVESLPRGDTVVIIGMSVDDTPEQRAIVERVLGSVQPL